MADYAVCKPGAACELFQGEDFKPDTPKITLAPGSRVRVNEARNGWVNASFPADGKVLYTGWIPESRLIREDRRPPPPDPVPVPAPPPVIQAPAPIPIPVPAPIVPVPTAPAPVVTVTKEAPSLLAQLGTLALVTTPFWLAVFLTRRKRR